MDFGGSIFSSEKRKIESTTLTGETQETHKTLIEIGSAVYSVLYFSSAIGIPRKIDTDK